jgi:putative integral membrane protein (TIGR02587 family)
MPARQRVADQRGPWADELYELTRAASGGLLFGIPLLYTMEVWWTGRLSTGPLPMALVLAVTFVVVFLLNRTAGFRSTADVRWRDALADSVEAVAIGLVLSLGVLVLLREVDGATPLAVGLGKVVYETMPFCIGIGVASHFLRQGRDEDDASSRRPRRSEGLNATVADIGATIIGASFLALNIAPTDEVPMLAATMSPLWLLVVMVASLVASYGIVFVAGFGGEEQRHTQVGVFQHPVTETVACYLVALVCAALMLLVFQRLDGPWPDALARVVVLGFPATVGGAAGRLAM